VSACVGQTSCLQSERPATFSRTAAFSAIRVAAPLGEFVLDDTTLSKHVRLGRGCEHCWPVVYLYKKFQCKFDLNILAVVHSWHSHSILQWTVNTTDHHFAHRLSEWVSSFLTRDPNMFRAQYLQKGLDLETPFQWTTIGTGLWSIKLSRDRWRHVTLKGQTHPQYA